MSNFQSYLLFGQTFLIFENYKIFFLGGAQWLSGRVLDSRPRGHGFESHRRHCVESLSKNTNTSLVLVQPRKTCPFVTERLLMGHKESNQTHKPYKIFYQFGKIYRFTPH